ncbi:unnamed protein product [Cyberlindnera jadinii]|uniref:Zn(2)-C6 fungal-type domain-containing protein n=2 Tax=Cyberlindnera jadinii (strain ATCC 18201 / CBS 1600 / BCRC 20928 / JCM 3617 / NBRC 0987 / NRRL Y-1542) TaxID=983966 RepID=A0A0H5C4G5_CYBJN|nr:unnamed protein product [Cyberlindnera jadinii]
MVTIVQLPPISQLITATPPPPPPHRNSAPALGSSRLSSTTSTTPNSLPQSPSVSPVHHLPTLFTELKSTAQFSGEKELYTHSVHPQFEPQTVYGAPIPQPQIQIPQQSTFQEIQYVQQPRTQSTPPHLPVYAQLSTPVLYVTSQGAPMLPDYYHQQMYQAAVPPSVNVQDLNMRPKRAIKRRTRTGCLTCRRRRIKCDERKPGCRNCEKSRICCAGYQRVKPTKQEIKKITRQMSVNTILS